MLQSATRYVGNRMHHKKTIKLLRELGRLCVKEDGVTPDVNWNHWASYNDSSVSLRLFAMFEKRVAAFSKKADYFCPIPNSGQPLIPVVMKATGLSAITYPRSESLATTPFELEDQIKRGSRVLLVDTNITLGQSFSRAIKQFERIDAELAAFAVIIFNDLNVEHMPPALLELESQGKLIFMFRVSEIVAALNGSM
jgi:orotate phosphoribosyltransferase